MMKIIHTELTVKYPEGLSNILLNNYHRMNHKISGLFK